MSVRIEGDMTRTDPLVAFPLSGRPETFSSIPSEDRGRKSVDVPFLIG